MHKASLLVTALVAVASLASADQEAKPAARPKIYFPRHIKRQFFNATTTFTEPSSTQSSETRPNTSKKDLSDLFPIFGSSSSKSSDESDPNVTTVVKHSTVYVSPGTPTDTPSSDASDSTSSSTTDSSDSSSADSTASGGSASSSGIPNIIVLPTLSAPSSSETSSSASPDAVNSTSTGGAVSSDAPTSTVATTTSGILLAPTGVVTPTSSSAGLLDPLSSLLSGVLSDVSTILVPSSTNGTDPATSTAPISETFTLPGTGVTPTPTPTSSDLFISLTLSSGGTAPPPSSTVEPPPPVSVNTTTPGEPTPTQSIEPTNNGTTTDPPVSLTSVPTSGPTITPNNTLTEEPVPSTSTVSLPTTIPIPINTTDVTTSPEPTTAPPATTTASTASGLTSLSAISTITNSDPWLPPTIIVQPSTSTLSGGGLAPTATGGIPSNIPKAITPNSGTEPIPDGTVEIQIGFRYPLNFKFLAENPKAAAQVLWGVPEMLSHAGDFDKSKAQMRRLIPLDTSGNYGFVTTLAIATYPENKVAQLRIDIHAPNSQVYNNPNALVYNISQLVNPSIDIIVGSGLDGSTTGSGDGSASTSTSNPNGDVFNDNGSDQSSSKRGETVGIAMGAIVVSVAYGTAMFIVARRYKRKKQGHRRASSISSPATSMRQTPSPVMGGALLSRDFSSYGGVAGGRDSHGSGRSNMNNSGRTAYISAPVAAENSLGWN